MNTARRVWMLRPKGWIGWILVILTSLLCGLAAPHNFTPQSLLGVIALLVLPLVLLLTLPEKILLRWEQTPRLLRGLCLFVFVYVVVVSTLSAAELYTFALWTDFLLPGGLAPWNLANSAGLAAGLTAFASQNYLLAQHQTLPADVEILLRGPQFISFDEARRQAAVLNAEPSDAPQIQPHEDPSRN